jgi:vitamin B12 transporter
MPQQAEGKRVMLQTSEGEVRMHSRSTPWTRRGVAASVTRILAIAALAGPAPAPVAAQSPADTLHAAGGRDTNAGLQAHPDTFRLQEVVVTATRLPVRRADAPGAVAVLTRADLQALGLGLVADAIRTIPGVAVVQGGGPGSMTSVFMRGGESDYVQVLVDGIQVNDPGGAFDWAHLRTEDIDRIEIVRGPASVLYGSDAATGVVQLFTRSGGRTRVEAGVVAGAGRKTGSGAAGSYRTGSADASLTGSTNAIPLRDGRLGYGLTASRHASNGLYDTNSDYGSTALSGRVHVMAPRGDAAVTVRATDNTYRYPTTGSGAVIETRQFADGATRSAGVDAGYRVAPALELRVLGSYHTADGRTEDPALEPGGDFFWSTGVQSRRRLDVRVNASLPADAVFTAGADVERQAAVTELESHSAAFGTYTDQSDEARRNTGWYAQLHATPAAGIALTVGGRLDHNEAFGRFTTGRAAVSWTPTRTSRIHASWGTSFKAPTFYENFAAGFTKGNPDLEPEQVRGREVGAEVAVAGGALTLSAALFDQRLRNLIQYTFVAPSPEAPSFYNVGAARARGIETSARVIAGRITARGHYTLTSTRVLDAGFGEDMAFVDGRRLLRRPTHQAGGGITWSAPTGIRATVDARYAGGRDDLDFTDPDAWAGTRTTLPAFAVVDAGAAYGGLRHGTTAFDITIRIRNILDARYAEIFNFPSAGRVLEVGVRALVGG